MKNAKHRFFQKNKIAYLITLMLPSMVSSTVHARDYFNPALLEAGNTQQATMDLSSFEAGEQAPGKYHVDIYINNKIVDTQDLEFKSKTDTSGKQVLQPCLSVSLLESYGVKTSLFPELKDSEGCANLSAIPQATTELLFNSQKLLISIPQAALSTQARGYVSPDKWDDGINALLLNYSASGANNYARNSDNQNSNSQYVNLRPGINLGPWRLRNYTTWNRDSNGQGNWDTVYTYAQRNIVALKSQLTLGDSSSPSDVFDSVPFRGGQIASDEDMLPESMRGYAPVVRGIARTNAQVIIRQNGYIIYQSYVAPGAFEITDMYSTGGSGDLYVTIKESDGSEQTMVVPFASLPVLQREGHFKYSLTGGQYRSYDNSVDKTSFSQGTAIYGLPWGLTAYGGVQASSPYQSLAFGLGKNLGDFGAFSTDVTQAWSKPQDTVKESGQSWRVRYSKNIVQTGTNFAIAGYRYSTQGYYSLQEILDTYSDKYNSSFDDRRRNRAEMTMSQNLWENAGSLSISLISEDYWGTNKTMKSAGVGYNNSWNSITYGLNYTYSKNAMPDSRSGSRRIYDTDQIFAFNISIPLDRWLSNTYLTHSLNTSKHGNTTNTLGLNGSALADRNLSWNLQEGYTSGGQGNSGNMNADYRGTYGELNAGYAYSQDSQRLNYGISGGIVAHADGVTLGQPLGETIILVKAPGADGVGVNNQTGVKTDYRGYAILPYASPYRKNDVDMNGEMLPDDVELTLTSQSVVPTRGAVVRANFDARVGNRVLMTLLRSGNIPVAYGATATSKATDKPEASIVGDNGQVYLSGLAKSGTLLVAWGQGINEKCQADYQLPDVKPQAGIFTVTAQCH